MLHWISLTADRRTALATRNVANVEIWRAETFGEKAKVPVSQLTDLWYSAAIDDDGGVVYFTGAGNEGPGLYRLGPGAWKPTRLGNESLGSVATTADGRLVVFNVDPQAPLYRANADGTGVTKLVDRASGPTILPDGTGVLYSLHFEPGLYRIPLSGGAATKLNQSSVGYRADVSPDGRQVLFLGVDAGMVIRCDLPDCMNVTELKVKSAQWSPDGKGVVYINDEDHKNLWVEPFSGGASYPLTRFADGRILDFSWSPSRKHLLLWRGQKTDDMVLVRGLR
jgi:hypothetical protein